MLENTVNDGIGSYMEFLAAAEIMTSIISDKANGIIKDDFNEKKLKKKKKEIDEDKDHLDEEGEDKKDDKDKDEESEDETDEDSDDKDSEDESDDDDEDEDTTISNIDYSLEEARLAEKFYASPALDYVKLFYGDRKETLSAYQSDDEYAPFDIISPDAELELISTIEAQETFMKAQYAAMLGTRFEVNFNELRKLDWWIKFNPALFKMMESLYSMTSDVNYTPPS